MTREIETGADAKRALVTALLERARMDLETLRRSYEQAVSGVTHEDARQEGDKDMRSTEASYVARGQAQRVAELQDELAALEGLELRAFSASDPVALGALVTVELDEREVTYFLLPAAGGQRLTVARRAVRVVTPQSPLGQALLGCSMADDVSWDTPHGEVDATIVAIV